MSMEEIIRAWKVEDESLDPRLPANPVGRVLSEEELLEVSGSFIVQCTISCYGVSCSAQITCAVTIVKRLV